MRDGLHEPAPAPSEGAGALQRRPRRALPRGGAGPRRDLHGEPGPRHALRARAAGCWTSAATSARSWRSPSGAATRSRASSPRAGPPTSPGRASRAACTAAPWRTPRCPRAATTSSRCGTSSSTCPIRRSTCAPSTTRCGPAASSRSRRWTWTRCSRALAGSRWPWYMQMHLVYFSRRTLAEMLRREGFHIVDTRAHVRRVRLSYLASRLDAYVPPLARARGRGAAPHRARRADRGREPRRHLHDRGPPAGTDALAVAQTVAPVATGDGPAEALAPAAPLTLRPRLDGWRYPLVVALASRVLALAAMAVVALVQWPRGASLTDALLAPLGAWDGEWYARIAEHGYDPTLGARQRRGLLPALPVADRRAPRRRCRSWTSSSSARSSPTSRSWPASCCSGG